MKLTNLQIDSLTKEIIKEITHELSKQKFEKEEGLLNSYKKEFNKIDKKLKDLNNTISDLNEIKKSLISAFNKDFNTNYLFYNFSVENYSIITNKIPKFEDVKNKVVVGTINIKDVRDLIKNIKEEYVKNSR